VNPDRTGDAVSDAVEILAPTIHGTSKILFAKSLSKAVRGNARVSFVTKPSQAVRERMVVGWLSDLDSVKRRRELANTVDVFLRKSDGVLVLIEAKTKAPSYSALETLARWAVRFGAYLAPDEDAVRRMVEARLAGDEARLIASALIEDESLVVWSCEPKRYAVRVSDMPALARIDPKHLGDFELNESGSRLHWDAGDVDINLEGILYYVDPKVRKQQDKTSREEAARYAGAIRALREEHKLAQADIPGLTERQVRRVEQGESHPRSETLRKLAAAHGMSIDQYLKQLAKRSRKRK
jgi:transcriptional regulator with XRE-family HTH domain